MSDEPKRKWWQRASDWIKQAVKFSKSDEGKEIIEDAKEIGESVGDAVKTGGEKKDEE